jgi:hypothetical protein
MSKEQGEIKDELARVHAFGAQAHAEAPEDVPHSDSTAVLHESNEPTSLYAIKGGGTMATYITSLLEREPDPGGLRHVFRARREIRLGP